VLIALDRQERGGTADHPAGRSATQEVSALYGIPVYAIGTLEDLLGYLSESHSASAQEAADMAHHKDAITAYRARYGVQD
jgi:orotate phosphoribosyltransferase